MKYDIYFEKAKANNIDELELSITSNYSLSFSIFRGEIESYSTSNETGLLARGTYNGKAGYALSASGLSYKSDDGILRDIEGDLIYRANNAVIRVEEGLKIFNLKHVVVRFHNGGKLLGGFLFSF